jgi:myo-inositol-1(or 4)-monophosphatase
MASPSPTIAAMIDAAQAAGDRLKLDFAEIAALEIRHKAGLADPFTEADLRAEATVRDKLAAFRPEYGFLGEEGGLTPGADLSHVWIVDPLDGTANFLSGLPIFAVNIALARDGEVIAGVTHVPMLAETFWAEEGQGAWLNGKPIRVSSRQGLIQAVLGIGIPFAGKPRHEQFYAEMERLTPRVTGIRRLGAGAVDMAYVACGRFDAYWEQSVSAWDMAAGVILVREAGGVVTDTQGGALDLAGGTVLASTPQLHGDLLDALRPVDDGPVLPTMVAP